MARVLQVRINAAVALGSITSRGSLGSLYFPVFKGLVTSLETAQNFEVFGEWQHQANLGQSFELFSHGKISILRVPTYTKILCSKEN